MTTKINKVSTKQKIKVSVDVEPKLLTLLEEKGNEIIKQKSKELGASLPPYTRTHLIKLAILNYVDAELV